ncbi:MAG: PQQ-like beta-propeller repeat protein, partial [Candidatus Hydrogenedentes bacterium]|nr:PQQ-like beta-propeller repeat protein [Candidatus Hydrogenedentota bacterium]
MLSAAVIGRQRSAVFVLALLFVADAFTEVSFREVWKVAGRGGFSAPNILERGARDAVGIVVTESDIGVVCFDLKGQRLWEFPMSAPVTAAPAVVDLDGNGVEEVLAADSTGHLVALDAQGKNVWAATVPGAVNGASCPAVADLDGDGGPEILVGDNSGTLSCFDHKGKLLWQFCGEGTQMGPVLVADIYDAPGKEVIVTSHDRHIYALNAHGEWLWDIYRRDDLFPNSNPILADVEGDKIPELYIGGGLHHFYRINLATHAVEFEENVFMHINGAIVASDLDGDGADEVMFGTKGGALWCYAKERERVVADFEDGSSEIRWHYGKVGIRWVLNLQKATLYTA